MDSDLFTCQACQSPYNLEENIPRTIPSCGHSFCSQCLQNLITSNGPAICPLDEQTFEVPMNISQFPINISLKQVIVKRLSTVFCPLHNEEATLVCLVDTCRICSRCEHSPAHNGHPVKHLYKVIEEARCKEKELQEIVAISERYQKNIEESLERYAVSLKHTLKERFNEFRGKIDVIEEGLLSEVNDYMERLKKRMDESFKCDVKLKEVLSQKIKELKSEKIGPNFVQYINEDLPKSKLRMDSVLLHEYYSMYSPKQFEKRLDDVLNGLVGQASGFTFPYTSDSFNNYMKKNCFVSNCNGEEVFRSETNIAFKLENHKLIMVLKDSSTTSEIPLNRLSEITKVHLNMVTYSNISSKREWSELVNSLNCLWEALPNLKKLKLKFQAGPRPMDDLAHMFSSTFWNDKKVPVKVEITNSKEELLLAELFSMVLPKLENVKKLCMQLRIRDKFTNKNIETLVQHNGEMLRSLEYFSLILDGHAVTDKSMKNLMINLPMLKVFKLHLWRTKTTDGTIEHFAQNALPEMKALEHFELSLIGADFTDKSICELFIPMTKVKIFRLFLEHTSVSEKIMEVFIENTLPTMELLEDFELRVRDTKVADENLGKILAKMQQPIPKFKIMLNSGSLLESQTDLQDYNNGSQKSLFKRLFAI